MNIENAIQNHIQSDKPRWNFQGVSRKLSQSLDIEETVNKTPMMPNENKLKMLVDDLIEKVGKSSIKTDSSHIGNCLNLLRKKYRITPSKSDMRYIYEKYFIDTKVNIPFSRYIIKKAMRSRSGVLVVTIVLKPDKFSCPKKCSYCPTETDLKGNPTQPKSYLSSEPAMLRALQYNFDVKGQLHDRIKAYIKTGNISDNKNAENHSYKLEVIVSGGTWESYNYEYRNQVMKEIYYAANTFDNERDIDELSNEININETAKYRVIGLTIETRPDFVTKQSIRDYRNWGITRIQLGVQHYDDGILSKINRDCFTKDTVKAIKMLKECGFKIVCHLMPDLPGSSPQLDKWMLGESITNPDLQFDDVKIYPTAVCKSNDKNLIVKSDILDWYEKGEYTPYAETDINKLINVLKYYKKNIQPWVRIQRLVRDIPSTSIESGYEKKSNLRQLIQDEMKKENTRCLCIRCMEIGDESKLMENAKLVVRKYQASKGTEYFITFESNKSVQFLSIENLNYLLYLVKYYLSLAILEKYVYWNGNLNTYNGLIGFCRLRIDNNPGGGIIKEIEDCALIREVHVYGYSLGVGNVEQNLNSSQHRGYGKLLVETAEQIALQNGYNKIAVISGVGTREYYKNKCGYQLEGTYMIKHLKQFNLNYRYISINLLFGLFFAVLFLLYKKDVA
jgi:ELP3 family radical SAM enzyme/protein acetyltransferase